MMDNYENSNFLNIDIDELGFRPQSIAEEKNFLDFQTSIDDLYFDDNVNEAEGMFQLKTEKLEHLEETYNYQIDAETGQSVVSRLFFSDLISLER